MDVKAGCSLGCNDCTMVECRNLRGVNKAKKQDHNPGLERLYFVPFRDLLGRIPWDTVLERRRVQKSWMISKDLLFQVQEWSIPM